MMKRYLIILAQIILAFLFIRFVGKTPLILSIVISILIIVLAEILKPWSTKMVTRIVRKILG